MDIIKLRLKEFFKTRPFIEELFSIFLSFTIEFSRQVVCAIKNTDSINFEYIMSLFNDYTIIRAAIVVLLINSLIYFCFKIITASRKNEKSKVKITICFLIAIISFTYIIFEVTVITEEILLWFNALLAAILLSLSYLFFPVETKSV